MSYTSYDTQDRKHRSDRHRDRDSRRDRPVYREEEVVETRTGQRPPRQMDLVRRREDSVEEVEREFPPGDTYVQRRSTRRARSDGRHRYDDDYEDDRRSSKRYDGKKGMTVASIPRIGTDMFQVSDGGTTRPARAQRVHHGIVAASH